MPSTRRDVLRTGLLAGAAILGGRVTPAAPKDDAEPIPAGAWGGDRIRLELTEKGGTFELDCAHGTIDEAPVRRSGRVALAGSFVAERPGPVRKDAAENKRAVRFEGTSSGDAMEIVLREKDGTELGRYKLTLGGRARIMKCR